MRIDTGQHMRMDQRMKLSPRMIQSMEILQLPSLALEERIEQELAENPLLEMLEGDPDEVDQAETAAAEAHTEARREDVESEQPIHVADTTDENAQEDFRRLDDINDSYQDTWAQNTTESAESYHRVRDTGERDAKTDAMANTAARGPGLVEQLLDQWRFVDVGEPIEAAGRHLISFIDDDGYLRTEMEQMINQAPPDVPTDQLDTALAVVQRELEPPGLAARDLRECLLLQIDALRRDGENDPDLSVARTLVEHHLHDIEMNRLPRIVRSAGLTMDQIRDGLGRLRRMDPAPGRRLAPQQPDVILPDVIVEFDPIDDRYVAALNRGRQPGLRVSPAYRRLGRDREQSRDTRQYIAQNMQNARWLIDSIEQRNNTVLRVVNVVIEAQREFLDHGPQHLRPLPMVLVADQLGIHVGTVSRAVSEKYLQTPRGIYPLRMFFSGGTESADGQEMSWSAVQAKLKEIVDQEDTSSPWSDEQLVEELKKQGIEIARRTVAKYRQQLNIPPARRRKQF